MTKSKVNVRQATREDFDKFNITRQLTMKGIVGELDGEVIAIGGLMFHNGKVFCFLDLTKKALEFPVQLLREARTVIRNAELVGHQYLYAIPDNKVPNAARWLELLGFQEYSGGVMRWVQH